MFVNNLDPVIFSIGPVAITWYGLVYAIGFLISTLFLANMAKKGKIKNLDENKTYDFMIILIVGSILTARIFYIVFYNLGFYIENPLQIFAFWNGGMSFHGGLIGAIISTYYFSKKHKIKFLQLADYLVIPAALMLGFGRIANFINKELIGTITDISWCVDFGDGKCRHPVQLYASLKNFLAFGIIFFIEKYKEYKTGTIFYLFLIFYGFGRFIIDFLRVQEVYILSVGIGQWMSLAMGLVGTYLIFKTYKKE